MYENCLKSRCHDGTIDIRENSPGLDIICFFKNVKKSICFKTEFCVCTFLPA